MRHCRHSTVLLSCTTCKVSYHAPHSYYLPPVIFLTPHSYLQLTIYYSLFQGKYDDAETHYQQCLDFKKDLFGIEDKSTLFSLHNLAALYDSKGRYDEAEKLFVECISLRWPPCPVFLQYITLQYITLQYITLDNWPYEASFLPLVSPNNTSVCILPSIN